MQKYLNDLTILDITIVIFHLAICIGIGFYHLKSIKTAHDFCTIKASKILPSIFSMHNICNSNRWWNYYWLY